jgi:hypothetical protein
MEISKLQLNEGEPAIIVDEQARKDIQDINNKLTSLVKEDGRVVVKKATNDNEAVSLGQLKEVVGDLDTALNDLVGV